MTDSYTMKEYIKEMDKRQGERLDNILSEVKKTNGRVSELEKWRAYLTGAVALAILIGIPNVLQIIQ